VNAPGPTGPYQTVTPRRSGAARLLASLTGGGRVLSAASLKLVVILAQCRYAKTAQRIFKYCDIQYTSLTLDKKLNSLIHRTLFCQHRLRELQTSKNSPVLAHPVVIL